MEREARLSGGGRSSFPRGGPRPAPGGGMDLRRKRAKEHLGPTRGARPVRFVDERRWENGTGAARPVIPLTLAVCRPPWKAPERVGTQL